MTKDKNKKEIDPNSDTDVEEFFEKKTGAITRKEFEDLKAIVNSIFKKLKDENDDLKKKIEKLEKTKSNNDFEGWSTVVKSNKA